MSILVNSYFSGAGLLDLGLMDEGLDIQQSFEIDKVCCKTLKKNFLHDVVCCDIAKKLVLDEKPCDVMVAGYPCTRYTELAEIHNTRTGDDLFLHFFRHIAIRQPEVYVVENVPGMKAFPVVMEAITKLPDYYVSVLCPVDANFWLPQNRERIIIIGAKRRFSWRRPQPTRRPIRLKDIMDKTPDVSIPPSFYTRLNGNYRDRPIISDPDRNDLAPTCLAHYSKDRTTSAIKDKRFPEGVRPYTLREYARLQGVPDTFKFAGTYLQGYRQIGNGVPVPIGRWIAKEVKRYMGKVA